MNTTASLNSTPFARVLTLVLDLTLLPDAIDKYKRNIFLGNSLKFQYSAKIIFHLQIIVKLIITIHYEKPHIFLV